MRRIFREWSGLHKIRRKYRVAPIPSLPKALPFGGEECAGEARGLSRHVKQKLRRCDDDDKALPDLDVPSPPLVPVPLAYSNQPLWPPCSLLNFSGMPLPQHRCICCSLCLEYFLHPPANSLADLPPPSSLSFEVPALVTVHQTTLFITADRALLPGHLPCKLFLPLALITF